MATITNTLTTTTHGVEVFGTVGPRSRMNGVTVSAQSAHSILVRWSDGTVEGAVVDTLVEGVYA